MINKVVIDNLTQEELKGDFSKLVKQKIFDILFNGNGEVKKGVHEFYFPQIQNGGPTLKTKVINEFKSYETGYLGLEAGFVEDFCGEVSFKVQIIL